MQWRIIVVCEVLNGRLREETTKMFADIYERDKANYSVWFSRSDVFNASATIILKSIADDFEKVRPADGVLIAGTSFYTHEPIYERYTVYLLLMGLALELLLKGGYMRNIAKFDEKELKTHDLYYLYKKNGLSVQAPDVLVIKRLSRYISWAGKYPIPMTSREYLNNGQPFWDRLWKQVTEENLAGRLDVIYESLYKQICDKKSYIERLNPGTPQPQKKKRRLKKKV